MGTKSIFLCMMIVLWSLCTNAQPAAQTNLSDLNTIYNNHIGKSASLYSGPAYVVQRFVTEGSVFVGSDTLTNGWIRYDGHYFREVPLQWDVLQNYVITRSLINNARLILRNDLIDSFYLAGTLVKFLPRDPENNLAKEGFYQILYSGPTTAMASRKKLVIEKIVDKTLIYKIEDKTSFFIRKKGIYYQVSNRKDVTDLFGKEMPDLKKFIRQSHLKWRKDFEKILMTIVDNYDKADLSR